tara:strand:- start:1486 stop:1794 length:309 start_codon:yes stop_codon:yes gene_type:complete
MKLNEIKVVHLRICYILVVLKSENKRITEMIRINERKIIKVRFLEENSGHKLNRKIHRDADGLYVNHLGMKGRIAKKVSRSDLDEVKSVIVVKRFITHYVEK